MKEAVVHVTLLGETPLTVSNLPRDCSPLFKNNHTNRKEIYVRWNRIQAPDPAPEGTSGGHFNRIGRKRGKLLV